MTDGLDPGAVDPLPLVATAFDGPIDVVGDVHGEIDALEDLLRVLGYTGRGEHAQARRLVFIGDLCDRGPDSPGVIRRVREMVDEGTAQCLLGNHELNVLRGVRKEANGWFFEDDHDRQRGQYLEARPARDTLARREILEFFTTLPLALERMDLRLVHACWDDDRVAELRAAQGTSSAVELYRMYAGRADERSRVLGRFEEVRALLEHYGPRLRDPAAHVPMLEALAEHDLDYQMTNPVRVLTSGVELRTAAPYFMAGKWRMVERGDWWQSYVADTPVIFGHYWRWPAHDTGERFGRYARDPFPDRAAHEWVGAADSAFCNDYCVGARFAERLGWPGEPFRSRLGAVRWPERELLFDDGHGCDIVPPAGGRGWKVRTGR
ncbi:MAG TPA: metallophosphoesterase [Steroidobacteraceae bacterium]|nr:metallophosphoesterase [Steroidobacteraceae bacterium]